MGLLSQKIERSQLVVGDHIYTWRSAFTYSHHGFYIGESKVVHFTDAFGRTPGPFSWCSSCVPSVGCPKLLDCGSRQPKSGVVLSCLDCFLTNGSLYRFDYGVPTYRFLSEFRGGTCTTAKSDPPEETSHRAMYLFQHGFGDYNVTNNNCEHFAMYCKTGFICTYGGIGQVPFSFMAAGAFGSVAGLIPGVKMAKMAATAIGTYFASRYANDLGVRVDVMKVQVEDLVVSRGSVKPVHDDMASDGIDNENSGGNSNSEAVDTTNSEEKIRDVQPVGERSSSVASPIEEIMKHLEKPTKADHANDMDETLRSYAQTMTIIKDDLLKKSNQYSSPTTNSTRFSIVEIDADATSEEKRDVLPVGEGYSSVASSIVDGIVKELKKPPTADHVNDLLQMYETLRYCAQTIKDDFVKKLVKMDPLAPKDMIAFANSSLKFLSLFPIDVVDDTLYFSVKNFIVRAYEFAYAKREVHSASVDFTTQLEKAHERIRVLTEEQKRLQLLSLEADDHHRGLKPITYGDQTEPLISQLSDIDADRESKDAYFRCIRIDLEQNSKELSDAFNIMNDLELTAIFRSKEQPSLYAHLDDLEAAFNDARAQLLSHEC